MLNKQSLRPRSPVCFQVIFFGPAPFSQKTRRIAHEDAESQFFKTWRVAGSKLLFCFLLFFFFRKCARVTCERRRMPHTAHAVENECVSEILVSEMKVAHCAEVTLTKRRTIECRSLIVTRGTLRVLVNRFRPRLTTFALFQVRRLIRVDDWNRPNYHPRRRRSRAHHPHSALSHRRSSCLSKIQKKS